MAVAQGYGKIVTSGSVFAYDVGDTRNSYIGEPTTNLATNTPSFGGWPGSYTLIEGTSKTFDFRTSSIEWGGDAAWTTFYYNVSEYTGQYITISAIVESFDESNGIFSFMWIGQTVDTQVYLGYSPEQDRNTKTTKTRERVSWSGIIGTGGKVGITLWMNNGGPSGSITVRFSNLQVEVKPHPTPFVNGTRSTAQGLLPLVGNSTLDLSNISFNSNAQMVFDGTNDYIDLDSYATTVPNSNITVESVVKFTAMNANKVVVAHGGNGSNDKGFLFQYENSTYGLSFAIYDNPNFGWARTGIGSAATQYLNQYIHMVGTYDNQYVRLYINGNLIQTTQFTGGFERQNTFRIGNEVNRSYFMTGEIPVTKIYNQALTAAEVNQNYRHYKTRFNLS
jgi:hypothetical protein